MYESKKIIRLVCVSFISLLAICNIQTVKAEGYTPGTITGEAGGIPTDNNGSNSSSGGGGNYVPEMDSLLGIPKNEVMDSGIVYEKPGNFGKISCSEGSKSLPNHNIGKLVVPESAKNGIRINYNSAVRTIANKNLSAGATVASSEQIVCYLDTNFISNKGVDEKRPYAQWKWSVLEAFNGHGEKHFSESQLLFGIPYTSFLGYSVETIQSLIDEGYFDTWIDGYQFMSNPQISIARKSLIASNIKNEHYQPKDYSSEVIGWSNQWSSKYSALMNLDTWYRIQGFIKQYYYYLINGSITYNVEGFKYIDSIETDYKLASSSTVSRVENIYGWVKRYALYQKGTNSLCRDEINNTTDKCESRSYNSYEKIGEKPYYQTPRYLKYKLGKYLQGVGYTYKSDETTDWRIKYDDVNYIDIEKLKETSPPEITDRKICDYVPNITGEGCRILYRDGVMKSGLMGDISEEKALEACKCLPLHNLTD